MLAVVASGKAVGSLPTIGTTVEAIRADGSNTPIIGTLKKIYHPVRRSPLNSNYVLVQVDPDGAEQGYEALDAWILISKEPVVVAVEPVAKAPPAPQPHCCCSHVTIVNQGIQPQVVQLHDPTPSLVVAPQFNNYVTLPQVSAPTVVRQRACPYGCRRPIRWSGYYGYCPSGNGLVAIRP